MYYVDTKTKDYTITTSYATKAQAERYGGSVAQVEELHLMGDTVEKYVTSFSSDNGLADFGRVRTIFRSAFDGSQAGRYMIYLDTSSEDDVQNWEYSGISFQEYGDANKFLKAKSMICFGDILVVENPEVAQTLSAFGTNYSIDSNSEYAKKLVPIYDN